MNKVPTIRDLATLSGFSRTTVSLALRNSPLIQESTRARIIQIAREQGYVPDTLVSSLMNRLRIRRGDRQTDKIAYLTEWDTREGWRHHAGHRDYHQGASDRARELGYELEEFWAREPGLTGKRLSKILHTRAIRGVLISPLLRPVGHVYLNWDVFACSIISFTAIKPDLHRASHSHYQGMSLALRELRHLGYRRIGFAALQDQVKRVNQQWLASYLVHQSTQPKTNCLPPFIHHDWDKAKFRFWVEKHRPEVVVSNMIEPYHLLKELGYDIPGEIGYASIDRLEESDPWSGIDQRPKEVGAAAVDLIVTQLRNNEIGIPDCARTVLIDGIWRDGGSTRVLAAAPPAEKPSRAAISRKIRAVA